MARMLKTYQTSLGFFDLAVAAPSMKAALEAWGADSDLFHQGASKQSEDPDVIAATMAAPGVVLKRAVGSSGPFKEHAELPTDLIGGDISKKAGGRSVRRKRKSSLSGLRTRRPTGRPRSLSSRSRNAASANARRKRPLSVRSASSGRRPSTRRKVPWMRPVGSTKRTLRTFRLSSR